MEQEETKIENVQTEIAENTSSTTQAISGINSLSDQPKITTEDIERDLTSEISTINNISNQGFYFVNDEGGYTFGVNPKFCIDNDGNSYFDCPHAASTVYMKDYGKTWALTKEELFISNSKNTVQLASIIQKFAADTINSIKIDGNKLAINGIIEIDENEYNCVKDLINLVTDKEAE